MSRSLTYSLPVLALLVGLVAAQQLFSFPGGRAFSRAVQDSLHAPWFFVVVLALFWLFREHGFTARIFRVALAAAAIALGTELAQSFVASRSASVGDLLRNAIGGVLAFVFAAALRSDRRLGAARFVLAGGVLSGLLAFTVWQPWQAYKLESYRDALLPLVIDFTDERAGQFTSVSEGSSMGFGRYGDAGAVWPEFSDAPVLRLDFGDGEYPTFYISEVMQRWASYSELVLDVFVPGDEPLSLTVGVQYEGSDGTSAYVEEDLAAGAARWVIPRVKLVPDQATGLRIRDVLVYTTSDNAGRSILIGRMFLQ